MADKGGTERGTPLREGATGKHGSERERATRAAVAPSGAARGFPPFAVPAAFETASDFFSNSIKQSCVVVSVARAQYLDR